MSDMERHGRRRAKLKRPSRRVGRILLALGLTAFALAFALLAMSVVLGNRKLRTVALIYILGAGAALCIRELRRRIYQIRKKKFARNYAPAP